MKFGPGIRSKANLGEALFSTLGELATFRCINPTALVEIRDLDELTTAEGFTSVVHSVIEGSCGMKVIVSRPNSTGQRMATVALTSENAESV